MLRQFAGRTSKQLQFTAKKYIHDFNNPNNVNEVIEGFKKNVNSETMKEIMKECKDVSKIHIFKINGFTKWFFLITRYQILFYCLGGALFTFYLIPQKWEKFNKQEQDPNLTKRKKKDIDNTKFKLTLGTVTILMTCPLAFWLTTTMGKRLVKNIFWLPSENKVELHYFKFFGFSRPIQVSTDKIYLLTKPRRFDNTIQWYIKEGQDGFELISTKGTGYWLNKELFEHLVYKEGQKLEIDGENTQNDSKSH